jgi:hypothetical protein
VSEEIFDQDPRILQSAFQRVAVNLIMKGKDYPASVRVLHVDVAALSVDFAKLQSLKICEDLSAR